MTLKFASIELARLYETQGHPKDALSIYKALDDDVLKGGGQVRAAIKRLELAVLKEGGKGISEPFSDADPGAQIVSVLAELNDDVEDTPPPWTPDEEKIGALLEKWLMLLVVRKRLQLFKKIRSRV